MLARYNLRGQEASDSSGAFFFAGKSFLVPYLKDVIPAILDVYPGLPGLRSRTGRLPGVRSSTVGCLVCGAGPLIVTANDELPFLHAS
jgi:hypothetical protein